MSLLWLLLFVPLGLIALLYVAVFVEALFHPHKPSRYRFFWMRRDETAASLRFLN